MASAAKQTKSKTKAKAKAKPKSRAKSEEVAAPAGRTIDLRAAAPKLQDAEAEDRVAWAVANFGEKQTALSSSFGAQSAVLLHMVTAQSPKIPVILVDTGYLFPETYQFIDDLKERLKLNLKVYRSKLSPAWQEARFGKLWEKGVEGIEQYNELNKVQPMNEALRRLKTKAWISGVRRGQSDVREKMDVLAMKNGILRVHPLIDWTDQDVYTYLTKHDLPYHPLFEQGYISIGDVHTSHKVTDLSEAEQARFFGLKRECGLHENTESADEIGDYSI